VTLRALCPSREGVVTGFFFLLVLLGLFVFSVTFEYAQHVRNLRRIPVRIHVNGTRGKSSVTRLLTAALNSAGVRTFGKTTGTLPRMLFPDGREYPVYRPGGRANVLEQLRIVALARQYNADAMVIECMALQPKLQWLSEDKLVQATHGVVTNAREDHLDVMGPGERDVALALAGMTPRGHKLFTADRRHVNVFAESCADRKSTLVATTPADVAKITEADMSGFSYHEHEENVALVLSICQDLGLPRQKAVEGMWTVSPDEGALKSFEVDFFGRHLNFINGFAANDPESTLRIWQMSLDLYPDVERRIAVFNTRVDRPQRSQQLAEAYATWPKADYVVIMGSGTYIFAREAAKRGVDGMTFVHLEGADAASVFESLVGLSGKSSVICGMANIAGVGLELVHYFENRSMTKRHVG
jgi:poly-gamma-glutamate synthase PgsB/CapB